MSLMLGLIYGEGNTLFGGRSYRDLEVPGRVAGALLDFRRNCFPSGLKPTETAPMYRSLSAAKHIASLPCPRRLTEVSATVEPAWPFALRLARRRPALHTLRPGLVGATGFEPVIPRL